MVLSSCCVNLESQGNRWLHNVGILILFRIGGSLPLNMMGMDLNLFNCYYKR